MHDVSALNYNTFIIIISFKMREWYKTKIKEERKLFLFLTDACFRLIFIH
jgi:hypothetical protein